MLIMCRDCKEEKNCLEFHKNKSTKNGFAKMCKVCKSDEYRNLKAKDPEKMNLQRKLWARKRKIEDPDCGKKYYHKNKERIKEYKKENREKDKFKINARTKLNLHIHRGYIVKPNICSECLRYTDKIEAHHEDYEDALNVTWLCKECHIVADKEKQKRDDMIKYNLLKSMM